MNGTMLLLEVGAACLALWAVAVVVHVVILRSVRQRQRELREPLLLISTRADDGSLGVVVACSAVANRLNAALREAEAGYTGCRNCGFENFKRSALCGLCGVKVACEGSLEKRITESLACGSLQSQRLQRARNRKEWTRKLDIEGKLFWYRDASTTDAVTGSQRLFPGYAVQFTSELSTDDGQLLKIEKAATESADCQQATCGTGLSRDATLATMSTILAREAGFAIPALVDASRANPGLLTLASEEDCALEWRKQLVGVASMVFPAKYAHFVEATTQLMAASQSQSSSPVFPNKEVITLRINRERIFQDAVESLVAIPSESMRTAAIRIQFRDEVGVDADGLQHKCFALLNQCLEGNSGGASGSDDITSLLTRGVFRYVNKKEPAFYLNASSAADLGEHHLMYFYGTGRLVGRALLDGIMMGFHLSLPLLKIMLGIPVAFSDLQYFDPEAYKSLLWLEARRDVKVLGLKFSVTEIGQNREDEVVDLIPNGRHVDVTDDNKREYLERRFRYTLFESVSSQLYAFLKGLYEVIPQELLMIFDPEELDYLLYGSDEIDVDDWKENTVCSDELLDHQALTWFWEIVTEMPNEYRRRLLQFATGASRVPVAGFSALTSYDGRLCPFTLNGVLLKDGGHVWSHACFNRLDLPLHVSRPKLKAVLYAAIETDVCGFTTN